MSQHIPKAPALGEVRLREIEALVNETPRGQGRRLQLQLLSTLLSAALSTASVHATTPVSTPLQLLSTLLSAALSTASVHATTQVSTPLQLLSTLLSAALSTLHS
jgi:hypothetical protein